MNFIIGAPVVNNSSYGIKEADTSYARYWAEWSVKHQHENFLLPFIDCYWQHINFTICQSLNLSLPLRDRDRADTIITLYHTTTTTNFLRTLELTYTQVWYIIGIISSSLTHFHSEKIGLIRVTYATHVSIRVNKHFMWLILKCDMSLKFSAQALHISTQKV